MHRFSGIGAGKKCDVGFRQIQLPQPRDLFGGGRNKLDASQLIQLLNQRATGFRDARIILRAASVCLGLLRLLFSGFARMFLREGFQDILHRW